MIEMPEAAPFRSSREVIVQAESLQEATRFYETVLGLPISHRSPGLVGFETGSFCLYVEQGPAYGPVFELYVPDLEGAKRDLVAAGCRIESEVPSVPRCYVRDPFGVLFNLSERRPDAG